MHRRMRATLLTALGALAIVSVLEHQSLAGQTVPANLAAAVKRFDDGQIHNDVEALTALVADDYVLVNSDGSVENKRQFLADFKLPGFKIEPYVMAPRLKKTWSDAALLAGDVNLRWTQDGAHHARSLRMVHVWAKRDGQWRLAYTQVTRLP